MYGIHCVRRQLLLRFHCGELKPIHEAGIREEGERSSHGLRMFHLNHKIASFQPRIFNGFGFLLITDSSFSGLIQQLLWVQLCRLGRPVIAIHSVEDLNSFRSIDPHNILGTQYRCKPSQIVLKTNAGFGNRPEGTPCIQVPQQQWLQRF